MTRLDIEREGALLEDEIRQHEKNVDANTIALVFRSLFHRLVNVTAKRLVDLQ